MLYNVNSVKPLTDTVTQLFLQPANNNTRLNYKAGQYIEIHLLDGQHCPFSIANAPLGANQIELHIRHSHDNSFTCKLFEEIKQNGVLQLSGPYGHCTYQNTDDPILLLAGGTGFAPIKAIIECAFSADIHPPMHLYWGAKSASDLYLDELAEQWQRRIEQFTYTPVLSKAVSPDKWQGKHGLITDIIAEDYTDLKNHQIYAAGPPEMVSAAYQTCLRLGLNKQNFFTDMEIS